MRKQQSSLPNHASEQDISMDWLRSRRGCIGGSLGEHENFGPGAVSNLLAGKGKTKTVVNVKNPALQAWIDQGIGDYGGIRSEGQDSLADFISSYIADKPAAATRSAQEIANLDRYYNGGASNELAALRGSRDLAVKDAAERAAAASFANVNRSRVGGGGPDSYYNRMALRNTGDIYTQAALDRAAQERGDWDWMERARSGMATQRQLAADSFGARAFLPATMQRNIFGQDLGMLGQLGGLDQMNKFYGLKYEPTTMEKISQGFNQDMTFAMNAMAAMRGGSPGATTPSPNYGGGGMGGGMGGGGMGGGGGGMPTPTWSSGAISGSGLW